MHSIKKRIISFCTMLAILSNNILTGSVLVADATSVTTTSQLTTTAPSTTTAPVNNSIPTVLKGEEALTADGVYIVGDSLAECWRGFGHFKHNQVIGRVGAFVNPTSYGNSWPKLKDVEWGSKSTTYLDALTEAKPTTLFVEMGMNDCCSNDVVADDNKLNTFINYYKDMLGKFKQSAGTNPKIFVLSITPTHKSTEPTNDTVIKVNEALKKMCDIDGYTYVDIFTTLYDNTTKDGKDDYYEGSNIHYNSKGADAIWEVLKNVELGNTTQDDTTQQLQNEAQVTNENATTQTDAPEADIINKMTDSQKEIYAITTNKYMSGDEYDCMRFNLIVSQFAIPYRENVQDVLNSTIWKNMATAGDGAGLTISENPYIKTLTESTGLLQDSAVSDAIKEAIGDTKEYNYKTIHDVMSEENEISYTPIYKGSSVGESNNYAYVTDLFKTSTETTQITLFIKDNVAVIGDEALKPTLTEKLQAFNADYLYGNVTKDGIANNIVNSGGEKTEIYFPVYCQTDSVMMYNAIFVNNAIRVGGYGTYDSFIKSIGNSQLYMDRWGNICAHLKINGVQKYAIVYPAYANPLFISTEIADTDMAGYAYCDFNQEGLFKQLVLSAGSNSTTWNNWKSKTSSSISANYSGITGVAGAVDSASEWLNKFTGSSSGINTIKAEINPEKVAKDYLTVKSYFGKTGWSELDPDIYLGAKESNSDSGLYKSFYRQVAYYDTSDEENPLRKTFANGIYSRTNSKYTNNELIPILGVDTTTNFMFNKAIASAYTRDSYVGVKSNNKSSKDYGNAKNDVYGYYDGTTHNWYDCLQDATSDYTKLNIENYTNGDKSGLFSNSVVLDKYYVSALFQGIQVDGLNDEVNRKPIFSVSDAKGDNGTPTLLPNATISAEVRPFLFNSTNNTFAISSGINGNSILYDGTESLKITDSTSVNKNTRTLYPFMLMHGYRKGIYLEVPTLQTEAKKDVNPYLKEGAKVDPFNLMQENKVSPSFNYANIVTGWNEYSTAASILWDLKIPIEVYWNAMYLDSDKFKTYAIFNYPAESLPSNSAMYNIMNFNKNHTTYINTIYRLGDLFTDDREEGRSYTTVPILDSVLDFTLDWEIWNDTVNVDATTLAGAKFKKRDRSIERYLYQNTDVSALKDVTSIFEPIQLDTSEEKRSISAIRWFLNDRRVSDILENYPVEDVTMLTYVWLNYYIPQTPFDNKVDLEYVSNQLEQTKDNSANNNSSSTSSWIDTLKHALAIYCETNPATYQSGGSMYTYKVNGEDYKADACCTTGIHIALKLLGQESGLVTNSDGYCNNTTVRSKMEALGFTYKLTSDLTDEDWKNLPVGSVICSDGSGSFMQNHTTIFGGWVSEDTIDSQCYLFDTGHLALSGGSSTSNTKLRQNYNYKEGDTSVEPMLATSYHRKWFKTKMKCVYIAPTTIVDLTKPQGGNGNYGSTIDDFFWNTMGIDNITVGAPEACPTVEDVKEKWGTRGFKCANPGKKVKYHYQGVSEHHGIDYCAPEGSPLCSPVDGIVVRLGKGDGEGNFVQIQDSKGSVHRFIHIKDGTITVKKGDKVVTGQKFAEVGKTGDNSNQNEHLHYQIASADLTGQGMNTTWDNMCYQEVDPRKYEWPQDSFMYKNNSNNKNNQSNVQNLNKNTDGIIVPAQLTFYGSDSKGCDGTVLTDDILECAAVSKKLCGGTVEFYNTGYSNFDGTTIEIHDIGNAVTYRNDEKSSTGGSYVFDLFKNSALKKAFGSDYDKAINHGRIKGCTAVVHAPNGCDYVFEHTLTGVNLAYKINDNNLSDKTLELDMEMTKEINPNSNLDSILTGINNTVSNLFDSIIQPMEVSAVELDPKWIQLAQNCEKAYGVPASITLIQFIYETGCGKTGSAANSNNPFGIKCWANQNGYEHGTPGRDDFCIGDCYQLQSGDYYAHYESLEMGFVAHAAFLCHERYQSATKDATSAEEYLKAILGAGYCPSSTYFTNCKKIMDEENLTQYDSGVYNATLTQEEAIKVKAEDVLAGIATTANINSNTQSDATSSAVTGSGDLLYPEGTVLTMSSVVCSNIDNPNNTLMYTTNLSEELEKSISLGGNGGIGVGTAPELVVSTQFINSVNMNFGMFCLAVNKNTSGDCLTFYVGQIPETREFDTETFLDYVEYFFKNPATALQNIALGFAQTIHSAIATGTIGNVFNLTWVIDYLVVHNIFQWYLIISTIIISLVAVVRFFTFIWSKDRTIKSLTGEVISSMAIVILPIFTLYSINDLLQYVSMISTKEASSKLALVQIESEVSASENLNLNFEKVYTMFKDQYEGIQDDYGDLAIQIASGVDENGSLSYVNSNLRELYDTVEYSNVLSEALIQAELCENASADLTPYTVDQDSKEITSIYSSADSNVLHTYYNYEEFVPVNYMNYHTSIFYYFYDYIKYQYLSYWANNNSNPNGAFSQAAKQFTLPQVDSDNKELMSSYIDRMWSAEKTMLARSYNGIYLMYRDLDYTFTENDSINPKDLFGLSYLFNMNSQYNLNQQGYPSETYIETMQSSSPTLENWRILAQKKYNDTAGDYGKWLASIEENQNGTDTVTSLPEFYPLAYIMDGYYWDAYTNLTDSLKIDKDLDNLNNYTFTPSYLTETYPEWYSSYPDLNNATITGLSAIQNDSSLSINNLTGKRAYARVYASKSQLGAHLDSNTFEMTQLEKKLANCSKNIYDDILDLTGYLQGDIRDSSLIFACALVATYDFNKEFSQKPIIGEQIYPQTLAQDTMDLDKFMRATFATGIDEIVKNRNTLYMIADQNNGGMLTVICIIITEVMLILLLIARLIILTLLLLASAYICTTFWINPPKLRQEITVGVIAQLLTFVVTQISMILILTGTMNLVSNFESNLYRTIASLGMALCMLTLLGLNLKMMTALLKDMKHYGGAIINNAITTTLTDIRTRMTAMTNVELKTKISNLTMSKNETKIVNNTKSSIRANNTKKLDNAQKSVMNANNNSNSNNSSKSNQKTNNKDLNYYNSKRERSNMQSNYNVTYTKPSKYKKMLNKSLADNKAHKRVEKRRYNMNKVDAKRMRSKNKKKSK